MGVQYALFLAYPNPKGPTTTILESNGAGIKNLMKKKESGGE